MAVDLRHKEPAIESRKVPKVVSREHNGQLGVEELVAESIYVVVRQCVEREESRFCRGLQEGSLHASLLPMCQR